MWCLRSSLKILHFHFASCFLYVLLRYLEGCKHVHCAVPSEVLSIELPFRTKRMGRTYNDIWKIDLP